MKTYILFVLLFCSIHSFGQNFEDIMFRLDLLKDKTDFKLDSTGFSNIKMPSYLNKLIKERDDNEMGNKNYFHLQDLNKDGLKDLIYSGPLPLYAHTLIFLNSANGLNKVYDSGGSLISIRQSLNEVKINVLLDACCCLHFSYLTELTINEKPKLNEHSISYHFDTKLDTNKELKTAVLSGFLRTTPKVDNKNKKDPCTDDILKGNQIMKIENQKVIVLEQKKNWFQILVNKDKNNSIIGWIKKLNYAHNKISK